jgi:hypothetical protein
VFLNQGLQRVSQGTSRRFLRKKSNCSGLVRKKMSGLVKLRQYTQAKNLPNDEYREYKAFSWVDR